MQLNENRPVALITGASSGIGQAYAARLAADGHDLIVVARRADRLEELKRRLEADHGVSVRPLVADLATEAGRRSVDAAASGHRLEMLVDCAALAYYMPFLDLPPDTADELVQLNVQAPVGLIRRALPGMVERGQGAVITFGSLLAFSGTSGDPRLPQRAVYAASKAFLVTFIRLLAAELQDTGVKVQIVCPSIVRTEFHTRQNLDASHMPRLEPEEIVQASMVALANGEVMCIPTLGDAEQLRSRDQAENDLFAAGMRPGLAERYAT